jgi:hypothetical protein
LLKVASMGLPFSHFRAVSLPAVAGRALTYFIPYLLNKS